VRAREGGASTLQEFVFAFPSKKFFLQKFSDLVFLNLLHAREARGEPEMHWAALCAARASVGEMPLGLILETLLKHARTHFVQNQ